MWNGVTTSNVNPITIGRDRSLDRTSSNFWDTCIWIEEIPNDKHRLGLKRIVYVRTRQRWVSHRWNKHVVLIISWGNRDTDGRVL